MRLNRLEINGFKSFPDRADLAFDLGVTAIVGPNGCGKSNVVDAITWVLGEQSAKSLRGERMEDVIFAGSDARKPTHTAEVKLKMSEVISRVGLEDHAAAQDRGPGTRGLGRDARPETSSLDARRARCSAAVSLGRKRIPDRRPRRAACATCRTC